MLHVTSDGKPQSQILYSVKNIKGQMFQRIQLQLQKDCQSFKEDGKPTKDEALV